MIEENNDITYKHNLKKENNNKINNKTWQRIIDISKVKLIIDINEKINEIIYLNLLSRKIHKIL